MDQEDSKLPIPPAKRARNEDFFSRDSRPLAPSTSEEPSGSGLTQQLVEESATKVSRPFNLANYTFETSENDWNEFVAQNSGQITLPLAGLRRQGVGPSTNLPTSFYDYETLLAINRSNNDLMTVGYGTMVTQMFTMPLTIPVVLEKANFTTKPTNDPGSGSAFTKKKRCPKRQREEYESDESMDME